MLQSSDEEMNKVGDMLISANILSDQEKIEIYINSNLDHHHSLLREMIVSRKKSISNFKKLLSYVSVEDSPENCTKDIDFAIELYKKRKRSLKLFKLSIVEQGILQKLIREYHSSNFVRVSFIGMDQYNDGRRRHQISLAIIKAEYHLYRKIRRKL